jgi:hypothetical protein
MHALWFFFSCLKTTHDERGSENKFTMHTLWFFFSCLKTINYEGRSENKFTTYALWFFFTCLKTTNYEGRSENKFTMHALWFFFSCLKTTHDERGSENKFTMHALGSSSAFLKHMTNGDQKISLQCTFPVFMRYSEGRLPFSAVIRIIYFIDPTVSRGNLKDILRNPGWETLA